MADSKLNDMISASLEKIKSLADGETVIGSPISTPSGTTVVPISKVSIGFVSGGVDYNSKKVNNDKQNFGGGGGTGLSVVPIAFLVVSPTGDVQLLPITTPAQVGTVDKVTSLIERSPDILERIRRVFASDKKKEKKEKKESESTETPEETVTKEIREETVTEMP